MPRLVLLLALALAAAAPGAAQQIATSAAPEAVAVTVYRDPNRGADQPFNLGWLGGYALITERRTVDIPAGEAVIRFEGVAGGIVPQSAIVTGAPDGVIEKNRDAWLLSPASLLDASLGRRVHIRRTSLATGSVTETEAVIRSGKDGAVVLETPAGIEALRCSGLRETLLYEDVPQGLAARPTLSVRTRSRQPVRATLTLSYLATGFDWQADYVAELSPDGTRMDLFAWLTLANGDETGFAGAETQAVAGRLNREETERLLPRREPLRLRCWPQGTTTSDLRPYAPPPPPAPPPPMAMAEEIVVTGSRVRRANLESAAPVTVIAEQEELGDLKLYRIPIPVTVAARSQKQVGLLVHDEVPVQIAYRVRIDGGQASGPVVPTVVSRNRREERLGVPLPAGTIAFFETWKGRRLLVGRGFVRDLAVGEEVELAMSESNQVRAEVVEESRRRGRPGYRLTVTNARPHPIRFEAEIAGPPNLVRSGTRLSTRDGRKLWAVTVPANSSRILRYRLASGG